MHHTLRQSLVYVNNDPKTNSNGIQ